MSNNILAVQLLKLKTVWFNILQMEFILYQVVNSVKT